MSNTVYTATITRPRSYTVSVEQETPTFIPVPAKKQVTVKVEAKNGIITPPSTQEITIGTWAGVAESYATLEALEDIELTQSPPEDGSTLVYNKDTDKYEIKKLVIDGGTF